ncbi:MAG: hypothetical protein A2Z74_05195 [Chloroflexi bacterium RBG_13_46_9]|nr:MAG: hypothetical protein A2Z74_05195 [Chloroflexi bacterium RBG_13_46_9]
MNTVVRSKTTILLIESFTIGDYVTTTAVGQALREMFPTAHITLMVKPLGKEFFHDATWFDEIIFFELPWSRLGVRQLAPNLWFNMVRFGLGLRRKDFDYVVVTVRNVRHWLILNLAGHNNKVMPPKGAPVRHMDHALSAVRTLGYSGCGLPRIEIHEDNIEKTKLILAEYGLQPYNYILLHPGASHYLKRWQPIKFAELSHLLQRDGRKFAYMGHGLEDDKFILQVENIMQHKPIYIDLPLPLSIVAVSLSSAFVGMDSGFSHIAAALERPTIVLYGPSLVNHSAVVGRHVKLIDSHQNCSCNSRQNYQITKCALLKRPCKALTSISAEEVFLAWQVLIKYSNRECTS